MNNQKKHPISSIVLKIRHWISRLLKNSHDHYFCFLPSATGVLSAFFLDRLFTGVFMGGEQSDIVRNIPDDAIIVYTAKYKSRFEFLFSHTRYRQLRLPQPQLAFDSDIYFWQPLSRIFRICLSYLDELVQRRRIKDPYRSDYYHRALLDSGCAMLTLVEKKGFYRRFVKERTDPLVYLIEMQKKIDRPVYLVPQLMFFGKKPLPAVPSLLDTFFGTSQRPGKLRKIVTLIRYPGRIFVELSQPLNLRQWLSQPVHAERTTGHQALQLRRQLLLQHNRHRQSITGPVLKSGEELKESILTSDRVQTFIKKHAAARQEPISKIRKKADGYLDEIAARYSPAVIRIMSSVVGWIINSMFDGAVIDKAGLAKVKAMSMNGPLVLIPCHKSHIDYLILSYILYHNNMPCPHIAAGKNLSFWPLGPIFRGGGAFFLRRTFRGAVLYSRIFSAYIHKLLEEGFNIELFIEGGRSRTGKLLMPKLGLISILLNAYRNGACENMTFVPVYIGYDRIIEEHAYVHEVEGGKKEAENLSQVIRARRFLKKRYGKIYINFHTPISIRDLLADSPVPLDRMPTKEVNALCRNLGWRIINAIDKQTVATPHGLVAAATLNISRTRFTQKELIEAVNTYLTFASSQDAKLADTIILNPDGAIEYAIDRYLSRKLLEKAPGDKDLPDDQADFAVNPAKRTLLEYYKNNCISYFVPAAFTALAILKKDAFQFNAADLHHEYQFFQDFFKYEFAFDLDRPAVHYVRKTIKSFIDDAILMPHPTIPDSYQITSSGYRKLKLFAAFLKPYFQSYAVVLHFLRTNRKEKLDTKDKLKKIQNLGLQMVKNKEIDLVESVSKVNYANGISYFSTNGIKNHENEERITHFESVIQTYLNLLNA
ncbi:glycerol-3-phosphate acyltransferase [Desulfosarcina alkanivorans]|uniref:Glycerol-3-phosphate acyltransferase n=1 Tax=Desulfosarcina alkanivorans TaxID=571177 RepID=A0A5K7YEV8_9BACT|nr:1-acyl-sn-glycerol-3-phosphate acyltransferase [Desulfosarcina alkanivorans]BBO66550.1 glycerol-3-phosphate acyltransferase [Desulfosarcina alkanivorans]